MASLPPSAPCSRWIRPLAHLLERVLAAAGGAAQLVDLVAVELARGADAQVAELEPAVGDAREREDVELERLGGAGGLPVLALLDADLDPRVLAGGLEKRHVGGRGAV